MNDSSDRLVPVSPNLARAGIAAGLVAFVVVVLVLWQGTLRGRLEDLCPQDAKVVEEIQQSGVIVSERDWPTSFHPCMTVRIRWKPELRQYWVVSDFDLKHLCDLNETASVIPKATIR
jgi:hypothetical protein